MAPRKKSAIAEAAENPGKKFAVKIEPQAKPWSLIGDVSERGIEAALAWQDKNWKSGITRDALVRGIVGAYLGAANAKR